MRQAYAGSKYRVRHVQSAVHDAHLPFTGMQLEVFVREPSEDVPQCRDTYPGKNGKRYEVISIHAPARGATHHGLTARQAATVSIHAPVRGATLAVGHVCGQSVFQSTRPRGARLTSKNILSFHWDNMKNSRTSLLMGKRLRHTGLFIFSSNKTNMMTYSTTCRENRRTQGHRAKAFHH